MARRRVGWTLALTIAAVGLARCSEPTGPLWGPNSPRNSAGEVIDPQTGVVIPGYPSGGVN
jgi:hypothetical protein